MNKQIDGNMTPGHLVGDIGLCFYDPKTETLVEFSPKNTISVGPYERAIRRFYIVKPAGTIQGKLYSHVSIKVESSLEVLEHKVKIGLEKLSLPSDFEEYETNNKVVALFNHYSTGIIPVDIYTCSKSPYSLESTITITLEVY